MLVSCAMISRRRLFLARPLRIGIDEDEMLAEYLYKWAKRFSDQNNYKYIKDRTMQDAVDSLCAFFGGTNGDDA